ncbi:MAG: hypothetical protein FWG16_02765 [Micrococcales bacterium]|nr:hypothetical protein [Micrococcales bacterium]
MRFDLTFYTAKKPEEATEGGRKGVAKVAPCGFVRSESETSVVHTCVWREPSIQVNSQFGMQAVLAQSLFNFKESVSGQLRRRYLVMLGER